MLTYLEVIAADIWRVLYPEKEFESKKSGLFLNYALLLLAKKDDVTEEDVHNAWVAWMATNGYLHVAMSPFDQLTPKTQEADAPFAQAIRHVAQVMQRQNTGPND